METTESIRMHKSRQNIFVNSTKTDLIRSKQELLAQNALKDKFFSIISHDLKNPFNIILGFSQLLMDNATDLNREKISEYSQIIHDAAESSYEMMQNLFHWAKMQRGKLEVKLEEVDINYLVNKNIKLFSGATIKKQIHVAYKPSDNLIINSDRNLLKTIIRNLLSNAIKFTPLGGQITISAKKENNFISISISDTGMGMDSTIKSKIFSLDLCTSTDGTENEKGTCFGLVLCKEFVDLLDGKIGFDSELGKGSTFYFSVPVNG